MSEIRANTVSNAAGTGPATLTGQSAAKAWVRVNTSAAIVDSFNTASITDVGTGNNTANFTSNMANANFSAAGCMNYDNNGIVWVRNQAVGSFNVRTYIPTVPAYADLEWGASIHRDLA